ncbi:MAG: hypothetical protein CBC83_02310 [Flavobacteriales bacterium TMED123]|nr:hypothetical protein [Candidatus Neomarinimicrobiota bacterium]MAJ44515.1 hypothetical protein [Candidatus Neomarinimicrobiota bacterium]OUV73951.1 MAG: hypothetical protein CBC83_04755 [Flavobacteriales bacterium TMED123]OUV75592.1 MAG: hypothetical protein CBC83_02310 [Flavobacteriales bacterium TMED123]|tara:strand:- start:1313 stop:1801 length:489 start_codon:yes stop_codon:yes gene_type:complete
MTISNNPLDAPIPGMSLTGELGAKPWQQPAQHADIENVIDYYMDYLTDPIFVDKTLDVLELGVPVTSLAQIINNSSIMEGIHSVDAGILVMPIIMEIIANVAEGSDIKYEMGTKIKTDPDKIDNTKIALAFKNIKEKVSDKVEQTDKEKETSEPTGLMMRRK